MHRESFVSHCAAGKLASVGLVNFEFPYMHYLTHTYMRFVDVCP